VIAELHTRSMPLDLELSDADGLTAEGLVLRYGEQADIVEVRQAGPIRYVESMAPRCAERNHRAPHRVGLMFGHSDAFDDRLGFAAQFRESAEGLVGVFRLDPSRADHARDVLGSSHGGLSVSFVSILPKPLTEIPGSHVVRRAIHIAHVAAVPEPAYAGARVLSLRSIEADDEPTANEVAYAQQRTAQADLFEWIATARRQQQQFGI
jgi:phage head maturation protease